MDINLYNAISKRKSFHFFVNVGNASISNEELKDIEEAYNSFTPLYPDIKTCIRIVDSSYINRSLRGQEYSILLYSENKEGYLQNIGYLGEQLDLYLVNHNIGSLWYGIGKTNEPTYNGLQYVIMILIHKVNDISKFRKDMYKSKRKDISEIWSGPYIEGVTNIVRFSPSACNTQPWLVKNDNNDTLSIFRYKNPRKRGIMPVDKVSFYNRIDIGIFLCILELCLNKEGYLYTKELHQDSGTLEEYNLNAVYRIKR